MKTDTIVILAAAAAGLYLVSRMTKTTSTAPGPAMSLNNGGQVSVSGAIKQIFSNALPGQEGYGWKYYSDGTSIGPDGSYYQGGTKVWSPT